MRQVCLSNVQTIFLYWSLYPQNILRKVISSPVRKELILWSSSCRVFLLTQLFQQPGKGQFLGENMTFMDMTNRPCFTLEGKLILPDEYTHTHTLTFRCIHTHILHIYIYKNTYIYTSSRILFPSPHLHLLLHYFLWLGTENLLDGRREVHTQQATFHGSLHSPAAK